MVDFRRLHLTLLGATSDGFRLNYGWHATLLYILKTNLFCLKPSPRLSRSDTCIALPFGKKPQVIIPLRNGIKFHKELFRYIGPYAAIYLRVILIVLRLRLRYESFDSYIVGNCPTFNFILNTPNKILLFENMQNGKIVVRHYRNDGQNDLIFMNYYSEIYLNGDMFNANKHTELVLSYLVGKWLNEYNLQKRISNAEGISKYETYQEHGDFVISNFRILGSDVLTYDEQTSQQEGFLFTDIATFIFSYLSGEPYLNKVVLIRVQLLLKRKWFRKVIAYLENNLALSNYEVHLHLNRGLKRKAEQEKIRMSAHFEFWYNVSSLHQSKFLQN